MQEVLVKTHLIITDIHSEFEVKWTGRIAGTNPLLENGMPVFALISEDSRVELNTIDLKRIEECAKEIARPHGQSAVTKAKTRIYIKEVGGNEVLLGSVEHKKVKKYAQMYDKVGWR